MKREIVCLCGSTRFVQEYKDANRDFTLGGQIVLTIGCDLQTDAKLFADKTPTQLNRIKRELDELHCDKIAMADWVYILNKDSYVGDSTFREILFARKIGKRLMWLEDPTTELAERIRQAEARERSLQPIVTRILNCPQCNTDHDSIHFIPVPRGTPKARHNTHMARCPSSLQLIYTTIEGE